MLKKEFFSDDFETHLSKDVEVISYQIHGGFDIDGKLFVKKSNDKEPTWLNHLQELSGEKIEELKNSSSSAVIILRYAENVFAYTFGYGRFLINQGHFIQDFGIKTALNTLNHESLRSIDLHSFDDQPIQKRSQVTKASDISTFGIDISKDILRSVTGLPNSNVKFRNISGGDAVFSFSMDMTIDELTDISYMLTIHYKDNNYKKSFSWVDNIKRIKAKTKIDKLDNILFRELKNENTDITIHVPEVINWDDVLGFSFTRSKDKMETLLNIEDFYKYSADEYTSSMMYNDSLFVHHSNGFTKNYSLYKSIYFEVIENKKTYILFAGIWYEIENTFMGRINEIISNIELTDLVFPPVYEYVNLTRTKKQPKMKLEREDEYNKRVANDCNYYLLDKKLVKTNRATTPIEVCDLLTKDKQLIHVKHKKGGSAGLSHLFAQGNVSAEILLGDRDFRLESRKVLRKVDKSIDKLIPKDKLNSSDYEIVYLILGEDVAVIKEKLPFFSKVNLTKAFENLTQKGFKVSIGSVPKECK